MAKRDSARIHFDPRSVRGWERDDRASSNAYLQRLLDNAADDRYTDDDDDYFTLDDLKALTKRKGIKTICSGKVLNAGRKKYRRWRKHDKRVIKEMLTEMMQSAYEDDKIGKRKLKKARRIATKRILSCFYGKPKKED